MFPPSSWLTLPAAFLLDVALGDPMHWPHPVRWMGRAIERLEGPFRAVPLPLSVCGAFFTFLLIAGAYATTLCTLAVAGWLHPVCRTVVEIVVLYYCLSVRSLHGAAKGVEDALRAGDLAGARQRVGLIVGRETAHLDAVGVRRAVIETVSENFVDGVLSPLFFGVLGGAPLAVAFKMASTLDSMVGYRNARYEKFGKAAARTDDAVNFLPARLSLPLIALAAQLLWGTGKRALETARRDGKKSKSPNAGRPEAAFAGALGVCLAGPGVYHGHLVEKPFIGKGFAPPRAPDVCRARRLMVVSSVVSVALAGVTAFVASL